MSSPTPPHPHTPTHVSLPPRQRLTRPWAVAVISWLLLVETAGLLVLAFINIASLSGLAFLALAILAVGATFGFARLRRGGWVNAVLAQGGGLAMALVLSVSAHAAYAYPMMVYGILMVLYLHQADVQAAFRLAPGPEPGPH